MARDIEGTVRAAFDQLDLPISDALRELLTTEERRTGGSRHRYTLADWGMDEASLVAELGDIFRAFGYLDNEVDRHTWPVGHEGHYADPQVSNGPSALTSITFHHEGETRAAEAVPPAVFSEVLLDARWPLREPETAA